MLSTWIRRRSDIRSGTDQGILLVRVLLVKSAVHKLIAPINHQGVYRMTWLSGMSDIVL